MVSGWSPTNLSAVSLRSPGGRGGRCRLGRRGRPCRSGVVVVVVVFVVLVVIILLVVAVVVAMVVVVNQSFGHLRWHGEAYLGASENRGP